MFFSVRDLIIDKPWLIPLSLIFGTPVLVLCDSSTANNRHWMAHYRELPPRFSIRSSASLEPRLPVVVTPWLITEIFAINLSFSSRRFVLASMFAASNGGVHTFATSNRTT